MGKLAFILVLVLSAGSAIAQTITPRLQIGEAWSVSIPNGSTTVNSTAPATLCGLGASTVLNSEWNLVSDLVVVAPRAKFYPGFRPVVGLVHKFNGWSFAGTVMYQWNPAWADGSKTGHTIGITFGPGIPLAIPGVTFSFVLGYRTQFVGNKISHIIGFGPGLSFSF